jgi:hypothetical protein
MLYAEFAEERPGFWNAWKKKWHDRKESGYSVTFSNETGDTDNTVTFCLQDIKEPSTDTDEYDIALCFACGNTGHLWLKTNRYTTRFDLDVYERFHAPGKSHYPEELSNSMGYPIWNLVYYVLPDRSHMHYSPTELGKPTLSPAYIRFVESVFRELLDDLKFVCHPCFNFDALCRFVTKQLEFHQREEALDEEYRVFKRELEEGTGLTCYD